jgi:hypothetical protein
MEELTVEGVLCEKGVGRGRKRDGREMSGQAV